MLAQEFTFGQSHYNIGLRDGHILHLPCKVWCQKVQSIQKHHNDVTKNQLQRDLSEKFVKLYARLFFCTLFWRTNEARASGNLSFLASVFSFFRDLSFLAQVTK